MKAQRKKFFNFFLCAFMMLTKKNRPTFGNAVIEKMKNDNFRSFLIKFQQLKLLMAGISLLLMVLIGFANVVCRNLWQPLKGSFEIIGYLGAITIALSLGSAQLEKKHIIVDIITRKYSPRWQRLTSAIGHFCGALFFSLAAWQTWNWGDNIRRSGETSETLHLIFYPFIYLTAFGFAYLALVLFSDLSVSLQKRPTIQAESL